MPESGPTYPIRFSVRSILAVLLICVGSCKGPELPENDQIKNLDRQAAIFPDYRDITIPFNIAPLNFEVLEEGAEI